MASPKRASTSASRDPARRLGDREDGRARAFGHKRRMTAQVHFGPGLRRPRNPTKDSAAGPSKALRVSIPAPAGAAEGPAIGHPADRSSPSQIREGSAGTALARPQRLGQGPATPPAGTSSPAAATALARRIPCNPWGCASGSGSRNRACATTRSAASVWSRSREIAHQLGQAAGREVENRPARVRGNPRPSRAFASATWEKPQAPANGGLRCQCRRAIGAYAQARRHRRATAADRQWRLS